MMERLQQLAELAEGKLSRDALFSGASVDTRTLQAGQLFFAFQGAHRDGHEFVAEAARKGAAAAVVTRPCEGDLPMLQVASVAAAIEMLARRKRSEFGGSVIAITGSSGKTTVKEMLKNILSQMGSVHVPIASYNNHLGVCLTLSALTRQHHFVVLEMGASEPGDISQLAQIARPQVALITNAGRAHLEQFGSVARVAREKSEVLEALPDPEGIAVLPADESFFLDWCRRAARRQVISYGSQEAATCRLVKYLALPSGIRIELDTQLGVIGCDMKLCGRHNAFNAAAAAAVAIALGADSTQVRVGLEAMEAVNGRLQRLTGHNGSELFDDSYNANPESVRRAIDFLAECKGHRVLVLGDMAELGTDAPAMHREIGSYARECGIDEVYALGKLAAEAARAFHAQSGKSYEQLQDLLHAVKKRLTSKTTVLVKGSRSSRMELAVHSLQAAA